MPEIDREQSFPYFRLSIADWYPSILGNLAADWHQSILGSIDTSGLYQTLANFNAGFSAVTYPNLLSDQLGRFTFQLTDTSQFWKKHIMADFTGITTILNSIWPLTIDPVTQAATQYTTEFLRWYEKFVADYEHDLYKAGKKNDGRVKYAYEQGIPTLRAMINALRVKDQSQVEALARILRGFRHLAGSTTDLGGRGVLISRLVNEVIKRLNQLGVIDRLEDQTITTEVIHTQEESPDTTQSSAKAAHLNLLKSTPQSWGRYGGIGLAA